MPLKIEWCDVKQALGQQVSIVIGPAVLDIGLIDDIVCYSRWRYPRQGGRDSVDSVLPGLHDYLHGLNNHCSLKLKRQGRLFSNRVWERLLAVAFGQTLTYGALAKMLHTSPRAVAQACRSNPFPGIIPCHRIVAANGIGGFMGQSDGEYIALKQALLAYEAAHRLG